MAKTKEPTLAERIEDARAELASTEERIGELSDELSSIPQKLAAVDWTDEEAAILEVAALERRRDGLPHLIQHLRRRAVEQEVAALTLEMQEAEERRGPLNARVEELQATFDRAREELNRARTELHELVYGEMSDLRKGIAAAEKRLHSLSSEPATPADRGPVVRATWLTQNREAS